MSTITFTTQGEPASKSNSRRLVTFGGKPRFIKSQKALDDLLTEDVSVTMTIYYATRRPDLDESVVLDAMQGFIYKNDRQVKEKHIYWGLDKEKPRIEIKIELKNK